MTHPKRVMSSMQSSMTCTNVVTRASSLLSSVLERNTAMDQASLSLLEFIVNIINMYICNKIYYKNIIHNHFSDIYL